jgi:tRNA nucleotidyltransferase (CCA-adding enzyme)
MSRSVLEAIRVGRMLAELGEAAQPSDVTAVLEGAPEASLVTVWLASADMPWARSWVDRFLEQWRHVRPHTDGHQLRQLGLPPGPVYAVILQALRAGWLDGEIKNEADEQQALKTLLAEAELRG